MHQLAKMQLDMCQCECIGANHGAGNDGSWFEVSDTFPTRWNELDLAWRLLIKTD